MKKLYFLLLLCATFSFGQTTLNPGEVMLIGYYLDGDTPTTNCDEGFAFVSFVDLDLNTEIRFSEEDFNQWATGGTEGDLVWTNTVGTIPALTAILITTHSSGNLICPTPEASLGTVAFEGQGSWSLSTLNEEIIVFQGPAARTFGTPISMLQTDSSTLPSGMDPSHVIDFDGLSDDNDIGVYTGPSTFTDFADFVAQLTDVNNNWATQDGAGNQGEDGIFPDYPNDLNSGFNQTLGLNSFQDSISFKLFPNPVSGNEVNIISKFNSPKQISVYDIFGKMVLSEEITDRIDVSSLSTGIYMIKIKEGDITVSKKLIVK